MTRESCNGLGLPHQRIEKLESAPRASENGHEAGRDAAFRAPQSAFRPATEAKSQHPVTLSHTFSSIKPSDAKLEMLMGR